MKILVAVKQVVVLDGEPDLACSDGEVDDAALARGINECGTFALEAARQQVDAHGAGEVVVVTAGEGDADEVLRSGLARGADRAIRVHVAGAVAGDVQAVAALLAAVIDREQPDLVLCGARSSDALNGATGVATAALARLPWCAAVVGIADDGPGSLVVARELEGGVVEHRRIGLPALLTVQTGINAPRHPTLRALKQARSLPLEALSPADLDLTPEALLRRRGHVVRDFTHAPPGRPVVMLSGTVTAMAAQVAGIAGFGRTP